jgi:hypothetical protein
MKKVQWGGKSTVGIERYIVEGKGKVGRERIQYGGKEYSG